MLSPLNSSSSSMVVLCQIQGQWTYFFSTFLLLFKFLLFSFNFSLFLLILDLVKRDGVTLHVTVTTVTILCDTREE